MESGMEIMSATRRCAVAAIVTSGLLTAQATLTVGPNGQYADIPAAVAAAQPGDTVRCLSNPPFQIFTAPVITTGITLDGSGVHGLNGQTVIAGIPAGQRCVVREFLAPAGEPHDLHVIDCVGRIHLEGLVTNFSAPGVSARPSIEIERSDAVSLTWVSTHGSPAIYIADSTVSVDACRLGVAAGGNLAGGRAVEARRSEVTITQPQFAAGSVATSAVLATASNLVITGRWQTGGIGSIRGGATSGQQYPALEGLNATLTLAPAIALSGGIAGFSAVTMRETPYHTIYTDSPGYTGQISTYGQAATIGVAGMSQPNYVIQSPFGPLWLNLFQVATYAFTTDPTGRHYINFPIPGSAAAGSAWTVQAMVLSSGSFELSQPSTFTIRN